MIGAGVAHNQKRFITHTTLPHHFGHSDIFRFKNIYYLRYCCHYLRLYRFSVLRGCRSNGGALHDLFFDVLFNLYLVMKSLHTPPEMNFSESDLKRSMIKICRFIQSFARYIKKPRFCRFFSKRSEKLIGPKTNLM